MGATSGFVTGFALVLLTSASVASSAGPAPSCATRGSAAVAAPLTLASRSNLPPTPTKNRWLSKALAARGGADAAAGEGEGQQGEKMPGVLSEIEIAVSSFADITGENLLTVENAKKGTTTKEVG